MDNKFYICKYCGNFVYSIKNSKVPVMCCGKPMQPAVINSVDASQEKHVPVVVREGDDVLVNVGEVTHPMTSEHYIDWIYLETTKGGQYERCVNGPSARFSCQGEIPIAVYAYCNLHGLWRKLL